MSTTTSNTPSHPTGNTRPALDEAAWRKVCETAATQARNGCGQSHDYYVERLSSAIDTHADQLPEYQRAWALHIAIEEWGYATLAERQETLNWNAENGYCRHGIALDCCPAGCGEY